jgi:hypothetical protein
VDGPATARAERLERIIVTLWGVPSHRVELFDHMIEHEIH